MSHTWHEGLRPLNCRGLLGAQVELERLLERPVCDWSSGLSRSKLDFPIQSLAIHAECNTSFVHGPTVSSRVMRLAAPGDAVGEQLGLSCLRAGILVRKQVVRYDSETCCCRHRRRRERMPLGSGCVGARAGFHRAHRRYCHISFPFLATMTKAQH